MYDVLCDALWEESEALMNGSDKQKKKEEQNMVSHPRHYNREGAIECIDEMELVFGTEATANFCLLNCWKYRYRAGLKNDGFQDLEKSDWYMNRYKELKEKMKKQNKEVNIQPWTITPTWENPATNIPDNTIKPEWIYRPTITSTGKPLEVHL